MELKISWMEELADKTFKEVFKFTMVDLWKSNKNLIRKEKIKSLFNL